MFQFRFLHNSLPLHIKSHLGKAARSRLRDEAQRQQKYDALHKIVQPCAGGKNGENASRQDRGEERAHGFIWLAVSSVGIFKPHRAHSQLYFFNADCLIFP